MTTVVGTIRDFQDWSVQSLKYAIDKAKANNQKTFPLMVDSPGGSVYNLLKMIDMLDASGMKIVTILNGIAMSAGAVLFAIGQERYMSPNSSIMIHDASYMGYGKNSEMQALAGHIDELNNRLYGILNKNSGKEPGYFENKVKENKNADLYFNSESALENGLVTEIRIPSIEEIMSNKPSNQAKSEYQNYRILMELSDENKIDQFFTPQNNILTEEVKPVDLEALLASLTAEQKKPILALQALLDTANNSVTEANNRVAEKNTELETVKAGYEKKIGDIEAAQDQDFINGLFQNHQLTAAEKETELKTLKSLNAAPEAKTAYKARLAKAQKVVEGEIPDSGERAHQFEASSTGTLIEKMRAYAKEHNLDLTNTDQYKHAKNAVNALGGK